MEAGPRLAVRRYRSAHGCSENLVLLGEPIHSLGGSQEGTAKRKRAIRRDRQGNEGNHALRKANNEHPGILHLPWQTQGHRKDTSCSQDLRKGAQ